MGGTEGRLYCRDREPPAPCSASGKLLYVTAVQPLSLLSSANQLVQDGRAHTVRPRPEHTVSTEEHSAPKVSSDARPRRCCAGRRDSGGGD